jgi:hypothetical protein
MVDAGSVAQIFALLGSFRKICMERRMVGQAL